MSLVKKITEISTCSPDKIAIGFSKRRISYSELVLNIKKCAYILRSEYDIAENQRVIISAASTPEYITVFLAIQYLGAVTVPIDKNEKELTIKKLYTFINPQLLITDIKLSEDADKVLRFASLKTLYNKACALSDNKDFPNPNEVNNDSVIEMLFTTGTTSTPKCVMHTLKSINTIIQNTINGSEMSQNDIVLLPLPLNHSAGLRVLRATLFLGATVVLQSGFVFAKTLETNIYDFGCTRLMCVPASIELLRKQMQDEFARVLGNLSYIEIGAGALVPRLRNELSELLPNTILINTWGSTETGGAIFWSNKVTDKINSLGKPVTGVAVKTIDSNEQDINSINNETAGRLCLSGGMVMKGYFKNDEATNTALQNDWLKTNDLVYKDDDGYLYMLGRVDDIINVGGEKIAPFEVENAVMQYDKVTECACVGVEDPDGVYGQISILYVVFDEGISDIKGLESFLSGKIERFKIPQKIIAIEKLPRNRMEKIDRNALRSQWKSLANNKNDIPKNVIEIIKTRKSIREFTEQKIPGNILESVVECGLYAPSGHNMQSWQFTVIDNSEKICKLREIIEDTSKKKGLSFFGFNNPVAVIIVTNDRRNETGIQDSSAASQNIMLAAHFYGVGSVWVNALSRICDEPEIRAFLSELGISEKQIVVSTICMGYPKNLGKSIGRKRNVINWVK